MRILRVKPFAVILTTAFFPGMADATDKETLVVTATGFEQKIQNAPASISVVTREQIEDKAYRDITDALKDVPGVVVTGGGAAAISVSAECPLSTLLSWSMVGG